jgi:hypothetical protein
MRYQKIKIIQGSGKKTPISHLRCSCLVFFFVQTFIFIISIFMQNSEPGTRIVKIIFWIHVSIIFIRKKIYSKNTTAHPRCTCHVLFFIDTFIFAISIWIQNFEPDTCIVKIISKIDFCVMLKINGPIPNNMKVNVL